MAGKSKSIDVSYEQLSTGSFVRTVNDLSISTQTLSGDKETVLLKDYFLTSPDLETTNGIIKGNIVNLLAINSQPSDHGMVAFEDPQAIGKITTADGAVTVQRVNNTIQLNEGDFIYLNDVIESNTSSVGIAFADETTMSVDPNSTMVVDNFVYDADNPTVGSMNANVLKGNFSFVSGQIAKTGNDAMQVTTPVLTIGVRGTQVAGKANTEGEDNEIVLLPNEDGSVGQVMIANESGEVLLTKAYEATTIANAYMPPTVPVILPKTEVLKKFATTISTTRKTEARAEVERDTEEAVREKDKAEEEKQELEEEKEELEEEAEALEEEKEELEEKVEELEEEAEKAEKEAEELEEKVEEAIEDKAEAEEKKDEVQEEIQELEEKLDDAPVQEREKLEEQLEKLEEEFIEIEEEVQQIEQEIEIVEKEKDIVDQKVEQIEKDFVEVQEDFVEIEQKVEDVEREVLQVIEKEQVIEVEINRLDLKFEAIVEKFEVFQEEYVQEFEDFIPEEEIKQFMEEAPEELIEEFQENVIEKLEEEKIIIQQNLNEIQKDKEAEDIFSEENVEQAIEELDQKQEELIGEVDELIEKDMELQEQAKELDEKSKELEQDQQELEKEAEEAYANNDKEAIEEIEQKFIQLDEELQQIDENFQEINEQYQQLDEQFQEVNEQFIVIDEQFQEVVEFEERLEGNQFDVDQGPGFNSDGPEVFDVPKDQQVNIGDVEAFLQEERNNAVENNVYSQEADEFFQNEEIRDLAIDDNVENMIVLNAQNMDEYIEGFGSGIENAEDYYNQEDDGLEQFFYIVDNNEELYNAEQQADEWFNQWIADLAEEQNINVAPWLDMPNDTTVAKSLSVGTTLGYVYGSDSNGDLLTYSIFSDPSGKMAISGNRLYLNEAFDNIASDTDYAVLLKVTDPYGASDIDEWLVSVTADLPILSSTSAVSMAENASNNTEVADINHSSGTGTVTYSITAGNSEGKFSINSSTGVITYNTQASTLTTETFESFSNGAAATGWTGDNGVYETQKWGKALGKINGNIDTTQDVYKTFDFADSHAGKRVAIDFLFWEWGTWDAHNHNPDGGTEQFLVYVNDTLVVQDDRRKDGFGAGDKKYGVETQATGFKPVPVDTAIYGDEEGELYTVYGTLDSSGDIKLGFGMRLGESESNESGAVDNITIRLADLDYEDDTSHSLTITATDASNNTDTVTQTITVTDANEAPRFADYRDAVTVTENGSSGTDIATVFAEDPDSDSVTYSITSGDSGNKFTINSSTGLIETAAALDYETATSHTLTITATDEHGLTATATQTINVGDDTSDNSFTQSISNTSIAAWGARYSHDMVLNNAWAEGKILAMHGDRAINSSNQTANVLEGLGKTMYYDTDADGNWAQMSLKYGSQFEQIWDFNFNTRVNGNSSLTDLWGKYIMAGGSLVVITEHSGWDSKRNADVEDFINVIDTTSSTNAGLISSNGPSPQNLQPEYRAYTETNSVLSAKPGATTGTYHKEYMGRGDLVFQEPNDSNDGAVAEWSREDTEAVYTGAFLAWGDIDGHSNISGHGNTTAVQEIGTWLAEQNEDAMTESDSAGIVIDSEYIPMFKSTQNSTVHTAENDITAIEAINIGNNTYIGGGMDHIDLVWDDSADAAYWAFNTDMDNGATPTQADDHYGVIGYDRDGDGDLWETTDTFDLDKIKIVDYSGDYLTQDSDVLGNSFWFKVTPVTYANNSWTVETDNTVTVANTMDYNAYLDLSSNTDFDDINYALIETQSALISEVVVTS